MATTVSAAYASYSYDNPYSLTTVPSSASSYITLFYDLGGSTVNSISTSVSARVNSSYEDELSIQTQVEVYTADINSSTGQAYSRENSPLVFEVDDWWVSSYSTESHTTDVSVNLNRTFDQNTGICLRINIAVDDYVATNSITSMPRLSVDGTSGSGSGSNPTQPTQPPVSATPSSPNGSSSVTAGKDVSFSWRISKNISGANFAGSELQYRYGSSGSIYTLGATQYDITTLLYSGGFSSYQTIQWRVRTAIEANNITGLLRDAGYDLGTYESSGDDEWVYVEPGEYEEPSTGFGGLFDEGYSLSGNKFYSKWSDWVSFQTGDYEAQPVPTQPPVSATPSSPNGSSSVTAGKDVSFSWRISKNISGANFAGSELQYRYGSSGSIYTLGATQYDITTLLYSGGFSSYQTIQWRVRTAIEANNITGLLTEAGYDPNASGYSLSGNKFYSQWSDWTSFQTGDYEPEPTYSASVSIVSPSGNDEVNGENAISFAFDLTTEASQAQYEAEYSINDGYTWQSLKSDTTSGSAEVRFSASGFPAGSIRWRVRAKANGAWSNYSNATFTVVYNGYGQIVVIDAPINAGTLGSNDFIVSAGLVTVGETGEAVTLQEATFCWRSGESNNFAEIAMSAYTGATANIQYQLQLAPYTLPYGLIQWYLKGKDSKNVETETEIYSTYILRSTIDSIALSPISIIENAENEITFEWAYISANAQAPTEAEIRFSEDGVTWDSPIGIEFDQIVNDITPGEITDDPADIYTGIKTAKFPSDYFSPGQIYWQVRCYDAAGTIGEYSSTVSFICYGLPKVRNFQSDEKPFATFTWDVTGQVSYELKIDNYISYGPFHGTDGQYVLPEPLEDGEHLVSIQVQNNLGLLMPWADLEITVANTPSAEALRNLSVSGDMDAIVSWDPMTLQDEDEFLLYRDNVLIKHFDSTVRAYTDRLVLGQHVYKVIQRLSDGYYIEYTHPAVYLSTDVTKIALLNGGPWVPLLLTSERYPTTTFKRSLAVEKTKIMGSKYPVIEIGDFEELSAQYEAIWPFEERESAYQFKRFFGKAVIIKSRGEQVIFGVLDSYETSVNSQTVTCTFALEQMSMNEDLSIARSVGEVTMSTLVAASSLRASIAPIEDGATASKAYAAGDYFFHNEQFCVALAPISSGETFILDTNYQITSVAASLEDLATKPAVLG